ncbi:MAG: ATP-binding protein [Candidatus Methylomirabilales bacterium]
MPDAIPPGEQERHRRTRVFILIVGALIVALTVVQVLVRQLKFPSPIPSNVLIFALVNINIILLLILILLVFRNLFKVYLERRNNLLGSRFRVKLVVAFASVTLLPAGLLFLVASNLITTSVDSWFNIQIEESLEQSLEVAQTYYRESQDRALFFGRQLAKRIGAGALLEGAQARLERVAKEKAAEYNLDLLQVFDRRGRERALVRKTQGPELDSLSPASQLVVEALQGREQVVVLPSEFGDIARAIVPIPARRSSRAPAGVVAVGYRVPGGLGSQAAGIATGVKEYKQLKMLKNPIKGVYIMLFLMATLVILFAAIWLGVHLARGITIPIQRLAEGTRAVAAGNLEYRVEVKADDEIGILVDSFNRMTRDLRQGKVELTEANRDLTRTNVELAQRRTYMETVLEHIAAGVLSIDPEGRVNTLNHAAVRMLDLTPDVALGRHFRTLLQSTQLRPLRVLIDRMAEEERSTIEEQLTLHLRGQVVTWVVHVTRLRGRDGEPLGVVMVFDDFTQLLRAQQAMAWREVARRIAHEIKNPLTPIKLSAQRLRKKFAERSADTERVFDECTRTIIQEVDGLKRLVDEFARYARMPTSNPRPGDLHHVIGQVLVLYTGVPRGIRIVSELETQLSPINLDPEQMKRALVNLVDNAVQAVGAAGEIRLCTRFLGDENKVQLVVCDTGPGIAPEDRERLFLPYFSTKGSGTGLGLAIVYRIVTEHGGTIRAEEHEPHGTRMVLEFPALPVSVAEAVGRA